jgi:hypothetical protein
VVFTHPPLHTTGVANAGLGQVSVSGPQLKHVIDCALLKEQNVTSISVARYRVLIDSMSLKNEFKPSEHWTNSKMIG